MKNLDIGTQVTIKALIKCSLIILCGAIFAGLLETEEFLRNFLIVAGLFFGILIFSFICAVVITAIKFKINPW